VAEGCVGVDAQLLLVSSTSVGCIERCAVVVDVEGFSTTTLNVGFGSAFSWVANFRLETVIIPKRLCFSGLCRVYVDYYFYAGLAALG